MKGTGLISFDRPFIIDVEASGFGPLSYPIEVGLALTENDRYCRLIRPDVSWTHWDRKAESLHHISRDLLIASGRPISEIARDLNRILGNVTVYSDGWVVDKPWMTRLFNQAEITPSFTISPLERILTEEQMSIWHETKDHLITSLSVNRHRASTDAYIIQETYRQTRIRTQSRH